MRADLLLTLGAENKAFSPYAVGWYAIALIVPVAFMAIPSILHRNAPFIIAFVALISPCSLGGLSLGLPEAAEARDLLASLG